MSRERKEMKKERRRKIGEKQASQPACFQKSIWCDSNRLTTPHQPSTVSVSMPNVQRWPSLSFPLSNAKATVGHGTNSDIGL